MKDLLQAMDASDVTSSAELFKSAVDAGVDPWEIHLSLFPVVQGVLNPPFINPHLPKMYRICREFVPYLGKKDLFKLVGLEVMEYARRAKMKKLSRADSTGISAQFGDIESAIGSWDREKTALLMSSFYERNGGKEFTRRLLLLGSGYLEQSLGHSISCTAFILLEMLERTEQDPWPAIECLAEYFCKGKFQSTPDFRETSDFSAKDLENELLRATSGRGIANLHHPITLYAIDRVREFLSREEYDYLLMAWVAFMGDKEIEKVVPDRMASQADYDEFHQSFSRLDAGALLSLLLGTVRSRHNDSEIKSFLIRGVCDLYQGDYNPHYLTGLGSTLWLIDRYGWEHPIVVNGIFQYLDYFFSGIRSGN